MAKKSKPKSSGGTGRKETNLQKREEQKDAFAKILHHWLLAKNLKPIALAELAGIGRADVSSYLNKRSLPTPRSAKLMAQVLGVPLHEFYPFLDMTADGPPISMTLVDGNPGLALLRINKELPSKLAMKILELLEAEEKRTKS